jgi:predicted PurR-regulated permease PerM
MESEKRMAKPSEGLAVREPATSSAVRPPTPIRISRTTRNVIALATVAALVLIAWAVPAVIVVSLGGFGLALVLSFPMRLFSRMAPQGLAIALSFLLLLLVLALAFLFLVPLLVEQFGALVSAVPSLIDNLEQVMIHALDRLERNGLLPRPAEEIADRIGEDLTTSIGVITENLLGGTMRVVFGTFSFALTLFGVVFVAASLLANSRNIKAAFIAAVPHAYRHDADELWDTLADALSRYLGGLAIIMAVQGALSTVALYLIGVPYPVALGGWVAITAVIPILGAWIGAIPGVLVAFSVSPTAVVLTALVFLAIQQLEGNFLTPMIQGQSIRVNSVVVFLGVIVGGALAGIMGMLFAVPVLAAIRVLLDFFRVRLRTE